MLFYEEITYRDYDIAVNLYGRHECTVQYCGDDIVFDTVDEAKAFIDDLYREV